MNQTDVIKMIVQQKQRHELSLKEMDEKIEDQIMSFYDKHDEALSEFKILITICAIEFRF